MQRKPLISRICLMIGVASVAIGLLISPVSTEAAAQVKS